jgi:1-acyl-sn-glycerol-3-phosphate acyltransferase
MTCTARDLLSVAVLIACGLVPILWVLRAYRRTAFTPGQAWLMALNFAYTRLMWRTTSTGRLELAPQQGAVIVCNHRCSLDPAFIQMLLPRMAHWMVAREYCENRAIGWFFRVCRSIPVARGHIDTAAIRLAIRLAQEGGVVGMFPEGRINESRDLLLPGRSGAVLVAIKARVPVIPCYIEGSPYDGTVWGCLFMTARVRLAVGRPIDLSPYYGRENERAVLEELTRRFLREIALLAGRPDFQPQVAGRFSQPAL